MSEHPPILKPCPFCGNAPYNHDCEEMANSKGNLEVICLYAACPLSGVGIELEKWNTRHYPTPEPVPVKMIAATCVCGRQMELSGNISVQSSPARSKTAVDADKERQEEATAWTRAALGVPTPDRDAILIALKVAVSMLDAWADLISRHADEPDIFSATLDAVREVALLKTSEIRDTGSNAGVGVGMESGTHAESLLQETPGDSIPASQQPVHLPLAQLLADAIGWHPESDAAIRSAKRLLPLLHPYLRCPERGLAAAVDTLFNECGWVTGMPTVADCFVFHGGRIGIDTHPQIAGLIAALKALKAAREAPLERESFPQDEQERGVAVQVMEREIADEMHCEAYPSSLRAAERALAALLKWMAVNDKQGRRGSDE